MITYLLGAHKVFSAFGATRLGVFIITRNYFDKFLILCRKIRLPILLSSEGDDFVNSLHRIVVNCDREDENLSQLTRTKICY